MSLFTRTLLSAACAAALAGCAVNAQQLADPTESFPSQLSRAESRLAHEWPVHAAVVNNGEPLAVLQTPTTPPRSVLVQRVSVSFAPGTTIEAVAAYLGSLGHSVIIGDDGVAKKTFYIPNYSGTVGGLLAAVSRATDVWFTWHDGTIVVSPEERVSITLPQEQGLAKTIKSGLGSLGDDKAAALWEAGMVSVTVKPSTYRRIRSYLERVSQNAAILSINAAVVTVDLNKEVKSGVDWESLNLTLGKNLDADLLSGGGGTGGPVAQPDAKLRGTGLNLAVTRAGFQLSALVDFLGKYGNTETRQDLILKSVSGGKVMVKSLVQVPYVKSVTNTSGSTSTSSNSSTSATVETAQADDGLEMTVSPNYDASAGAVAMEVTLSLKAVLGYNKLSAGNQLGELTQPTTAERKFESSIRMRPGETVVLGGVTYEQLSDKQGRPLFVPEGSQLARSDVALRKQSIFIVLRPSATTFGPIKGSEALDWFMEGKLPGAEDYVSERVLRAPPAPPVKVETVGTQPRDPARSAPPAVMPQAPKRTAKPVPARPLQKAPAAAAAARADATPKRAEAGDSLASEAPRNVQAQAMEGRAPAGLPDAAVIAPTGQPSAQLPPAAAAVPAATEGVKADSAAPAEPRKPVAPESATNLSAVAAEASGTRTTPAEHVSPPAAPAAHPDARPEPAADVRSDTQGHKAAKTATRKSGAGKANLSKAAARLPAAHDTPPVTGASSTSDRASRSGNEVIRVVSEPKAQLAADEVLESARAAAIERLRERDAARAAGETQTSVPVPSAPRTEEVVLPLPPLPNPPGGKK